MSNQRRFGLLIGLEMRVNLVPAASKVLVGEMFAVIFTQQNKRNNHSLVHTRNRCHAHELFT